MSQPTCGRCPAFLLFPETVAAGLCHGCQSPPPEMRVNTALEMNCFGRLMTVVERRDLMDAARRAAFDSPQMQTNTEGI